MAGVSGPEHWDGVYGAREDAALTWYEAVPEVSLRLIAAHAAGARSAVEVGGGTSRLVDHLLERGLEVAVLDISERALAASRERLGDRAAAVDWIAADVTGWRPGRSYDLWHDRAVFHFLTAAEARAGYVRALTGALATGGTAIVATFADDGPEMCSGLPVVRYAPADLAATFEALAPGALEPVAAERHAHRTPKGNVQKFQVSVFRRR